MMYPAASKSLIPITLKMPGEPGDMEAMKGAFLGWVSQGLQHEVIVMASCCKRAVVRKGITATAKSTHTMSLVLHHGPEA